MKPVRRKPKQVRFPGIIADAQALGVHRVTLYKMLAGYPGFVGLKTLRRRYDALKRNDTASRRGKGGAR